jgi:thiol-disulfide isomerase/thioredoxin
MSAGRWAAAAPAARLLAVAVGTALAVAGCAGEGALPDRAADDRGYVSGDGSRVELAPSQRGEPVRVSGVSAEGERIDLADWRGDVVVLNVWYNTCPPCRVEAPDLAALAAETADEGVRFVGVNTRDDPATAQAFQRTFDIGYPSIMDAGGEAVLALRGEVAPQAVPTTLVIDRQGRVAARILGTADGGILRTLVTDAVAEPA